MRRLIPASLMLVAIVVLAVTILLAAPPDATSGRPQYTSDNQLLQPTDYREWIFLSSGLGMSYSATPGHEMFTNVFVPQWAYQAFLKSGKWPDKTMFVVEERRRYQQRFDQQGRTLSERFHGHRRRGERRNSLCR